MATIDPTKTTIPAEMLQVQNRIETPSLNLSDPTPALQGVFSTLPQEQRQLEVDQAGQRTGAANLNSLVQSLTGMGADQAALEEKAGINAIEKDVTDLTNQLNLIKAESQTIPLQTQQEYQGRLSTQAGVGAIETGKLRENAIKALTTSALLQARQGSLLTAQNQVDRAIQLKYEPIKAQIEATRQQLEINDKYFITPAERKLAEKQTIALAERERQIKKQEEGEQQMLTLITNASSQGASQDLLRRAQAAKTPMEASMILGQYAGDYWGTKIKIAQYNKILSETNKIDTQTSGLKLQPTGVVTTPNGDAVSLPNETLGAIGKLKLTEGQSNAVAFVSRMIQSDSAIKKQLGAISPTGGFYETSGYDPTSLGSSIGRTVGSDNSRIYNTNAQDFIRAKLRKESGATITPDEFNADAAIYTPSGAGLDQRDLLLAETKREEAIKSMIAQAGPAAPYLQQYFQQVKANNGVPYDPYLDGQVIPSVSKNSGTSMSSDAYANSLITP